MFENVFLNVAGKKKEGCRRPTFYPRPRLNKQTFLIRLQRAPPPPIRGCAPPNRSPRSLAPKMRPPPHLSLGPSANPFWESALAGERENALLGNSI